MMKYIIYLCCIQINDRDFRHATNKQISKRSSSKDTGGKGMILRELFLGLIMAALYS